jgi:hypothetical protein
MGGAHMLTISNAQMDVLGRQPRARFEADLARHLRQYFPHECERGDVAGFVRMGIDRAAAHGVDTQGDTALYLNLMAMLGAEFDEDPQLPWAARGLDDLSTPSPSARLDAVYDSAVAFLESTSGRKNLYLVRAKLRIRRQEFDFLSRFRWNALPPVLAGILEKIYPQRAAYAGESAMKDLTLLAASTARKRGVSPGRAAGIHALHMFVLGSGYERDPFYPWAAEILDARGAGPVDARFDRVLEASLAYMERTLRTQ